MLRAAPAEQLEAVIDRTVVPREHRRVFLGKAAAAMLAALGLGQTGCSEPPQPTGSRPDYPVTTGIEPDMPEPAAAPMDDDTQNAEAPEQAADEPPTDQTDEPPPEQVILGIGYIGSPGRRLFECAAVNHQTQHVFQVPATVL